MILILVLSFMLFGIPFYLKEEMKKTMESFLYVEKEQILKIKQLKKELLLLKTKCNEIKKYIELNRRNYV